MERQTCWYSVVRYRNNATAGEVINVGLILHAVSDNRIIYKILDENNAKIKGISNNDVDIATYKVKKDYLLFLLESMEKNLFVGEENISLFDQNFLYSCYENFKSESMFLSEPAFAKTSNLDMLFDNLFSTYVGAKFLSTDQRAVSIKTILRNTFEERNLMRKIKRDFSISPIDDLNDVVKVQIDFGFKNGIWNYLQVVQFNNSSGSRNTEWFAKTKLLIDSYLEDMQLYLMYKTTEDLDFNKEISQVINYFTKADSRVKSIDVNDQGALDSLCNYIEKEAHDLVS